MFQIFQFFRTSIIFANFAIDWIASCLANCFPAKRVLSNVLGNVTLLITSSSFSLSSSLPNAHTLQNEFAHENLASGPT